jgi:hypothetical protein
MSGPDRPGLLGDLFEAAEEHPLERRVLLVLGVVGLSLALVLGAFLVGRVVADGTATSAEAAADDTSVESQGEGVGRGDGGQTGAGESSGSAGHPATTRDGRLAGPAYRGAVDPVPVSATHAGCRAPAGVDSAGNRITYPARNMLDSSASTAWRCYGDGRGVTLTFSLARPRRIAQVGLVPGYAKTDPYSGADRYAENRRISKVRWAFDGGAWAEQTFRTGRFDRAMQTMRIPLVRTRRVTVTIEDSVPGPRNTVAVSTVNLGSPR